MKSSIDLTENRDFADRTHVQIMPLLKEPWKLPHWTQVYDDESLGERMLVLTGDKEERTRKHQCYMAESEQYCDRCGKKLFPYNHYRICDLCVSELDIEVNGTRRIPWESSKFSNDAVLDNPLLW